MINEIDYAWAAGFIDGDGSFSLRVYKYEYRHMIQPIIQLTQISLEPLEKIYKLAGGGTFSSETNKKSGKEINRLAITGRDRVLTFLLRIQPYLINKQQPCNLLIEACKKQKSKSECGRKINCMSVYSSEEWIWFFEQKRQIEELNSMT